MDNTFDDIIYRPNTPLIVSAYTVDSHLGDYYKRASFRLANSLLKFDLPFVIFPLKGAKNWLKNCALKPTVILYCLNKWDRPILWIDIDGEVFKFPSLFENFDAEIGLCSYGGHWLTGTLYIKPSAKHFIAKWKEITTDKEADEVTLLHLYRKQNNNPKLKLIPRVYNEVIHQNTDLTKVVIGHYIRPDVAPCRNVKAVPLE